MDKKACRHRAIETRMISRRSLSCMKNYLTSQETPPPSPRRDGQTKTNTEAEGQKSAYDRLESWHLPKRTETSKLHHEWTMPVRDGWVIVRFLRIFFLLRAHESWMDQKIHGYIFKKKLTIFYKILYK